MYFKGPYLRGACLVILFLRATHVCLKRDTPYSKIWECSRKQTGQKCLPFLCANTYVCVCAAGRGQQMSECNIYDVRG